MNLIQQLFQKLYTSNVLSVEIPTIPIAFLTPLTSRQLARTALVWVLILLVVAGGAIQQLATTTGSGTQRIIPIIVNPDRLTPPGYSRPEPETKPKTGTFRTASLILEQEENLETTIFLPTCVIKDAACAVFPVSREWKT